jgi:Kef-type K+ transport system membrane component KefB
MDMTESATLVGYHANILLLVGVAVFLGAVGGRVFQSLKVPQVVGYIIIGLIVGQTGFGLISRTVVEEMRPISMFALGLIGLSIGGELKLPELRRRGRQFLTILLSEGIGAFIIVGGATGMLIWFFTGDAKIAIAQGLLLGAISSATAPAATVSVLWEYKTRGPLTNTLLAIVALDDGLGLLLFGFASSIAGVLLSGGSLTIGAILGTPAYEIIASILLGSVSALMLILLLRWSSDHDKQLVFTIGTVMLNMGLSVALGMDAILAAMALGATLVNVAPRRSRDAFQSIKKFAPPIYVLFFVLVGAELQLFGTSAVIWIIAGTYVVGRTAGKIIGAYYGARMSGAPETVQRYLGMGLFAQGGVAVGLSIVAAHRFEATIGGEIIIIVTVTTMLVELLGPPFVKLAVTKAGEVGLGISEEDLIRSYTVADMMDPTPPVIQIDDRMEKIFDVISSSASYLFYPVVDELGRLQGVVGLEDLKPILGEQAAVRELLVAYDLMENCSESITPGTPLQEAFNIMRKAQLGFLPVVENKSISKLVGFLDHHVINEKLARELLRRQQAASV